MFDLVIKDAEIFDGSGAKPMRGDLGVTGGRIAEMGPKLGAARETVKADVISTSLRDAVKYCVEATLIQEGKDRTNVEKIRDGALIRSRPAAEAESPALHLP